LAWHISLHLATLNSVGLERLGIDASTPDPEGGVIRRQPGSLEPDGVLEETATELAIAQLGDTSLLDGLRMLRAGTDIYHLAGVTTAQSGFTNRSQMQGIRWASRFGFVPLRLILWPGWETADEMLDGSFRFETGDDAWLSVGAVKLIADGSIQGYTGYLSLPYHVPPGDDPSYRGYPRIPRPELIERVERYHRAGLQIAAHGNGDAAIDDILDAFERAQRASPRTDSRHIVIHAQMAREDQLDRMQELGIIPSFFSLHTYYWGDRHRDIFMGPERAARMSPARSALRRGMIFTIHADSPVVPMDPLRLVWSAVRRQSVSGATIGPEQRISVSDALRAVTINAAYQHFEEKDKGSIEVGKLADFVLLSELPSDRPGLVDRIPRIRVLETIIGGETVYRAEQP
jgi:predicted amidohydrolase YtcJ